MINKALGDPEETDRVPNQPAVSAWKHSARLHQHNWREEHGWPAGLRPGSKKDDDPKQLIGNRIDYDFAKATGANFLHPSAQVAAGERTSPQYHQKYQMLDEVRLYTDLLSSMPLCFNLFSPLRADPALAVATTHRWFPTLCDPAASVHIEFEWSPGRRNAEWLNDGTAFDVAIFVQNPDDRVLIGIETKYHEHPVSEPAVRKKRDGRMVTRELKRRYVELTNEVGLLSKESTIADIWATPIEQVWRDHLLALACGAHPSQGWDRTHYVLAAPTGNESWAHVASEYEKVMAPEAANSFEHRAIDDLVNEAADLLPQASQFQRRYLDVNIRRHPLDTAV